MNTKYINIDGHAYIYIYVYINTPYIGVQHEQDWMANRSEWLMEHHILNCQFTNRIDGPFTEHAILDI